MIMNPLANSLNDFIMKDANDTPFANSLKSYDPTEAMETLNTDVKKQCTNKSREDIVTVGRYPSDPKPPEVRFLMVLWPNYILTFLCTFTFWALVGESPRAGAIVAPGHHCLTKPKAHPSVGRLDGKKIGRASCRERV